MRIVSGGFPESACRFPHLHIYLRASAVTLVNQIRHRGRSYETAIDEHYLENLSKLYEEWIAEYPGKLLVLDIDKEDFITDEHVREKILERIMAELDLSASKK